METQQAPLTESLPLVSIVTPSLNQAEFIQDTIDSVLGQDYPGIEYIIVDGGSTDGTLQVLQDLPKRPGLSWISEPDKGQADAIQKGFAMARGSIVAWLNSDDIYLDRTCIRRIVEFFNRYPEADIVSAGGFYINRAGRWGGPILVTRKAYTTKRLTFRDQILQPATFFRREVVQTTPLDTTLHFAFDWDFFIRASMRHNILPVDWPIAGYRWYATNKTAYGGPKRARELLLVVGRYRGKLSYQYPVLCFYWLLYLMTELLPGRAKVVAKKAVLNFTRAVMVITFGRITSV